MKYPKATISILIIAVPVVFAFVMRAIFGIRGWQSLWTIMSLSFLLLVPFGVGALTIALSDLQSVSKFGYRFFMPWMPIFVFFGLTLLFSIEGWACWLMILPFFLIAASLGGLTAGYFRLKKAKEEKLYISFIAFLPLLLSPLEQMITATPTRYEAYTSITIHAPKETIWNHVTRVREIKAEEDRGWFTRMLGFPRPVKAELNYEGVGAYRKAIFDKGLVFHETVSLYQHQKKMVFSILANPYEIPSATMDEHIAVGGQYFNMLDGTYELQQSGNNTYQLNLYSHFTLTTTFNFYAGWWAKLIMKDIQNNILQIVKKRSEAESSIK